VREGVRVREKGEGVRKREEEAKRVREELRD